MVRRSFSIVSIALLVLLVGCQGPVGLGVAPAGTLNITLNLSQPSWGASPRARLLLANVTTVDVKLIRDKKTITSKTLTFDGQAVSFSADVEARVPYRIEAEARNAAGDLVFAGSGKFELFKDRSFSLYLLPVLADGTNLWPALMAVDQPVGGVFPDQTSPEKGQSQTFLIDFGDAATGFTFLPPPEGLELYLQRLDGSPITLPETRLVALDDLGDDQSLWATYYQTGTGALGAVGSFTIPVTSLTVPTDLELGPGGKVDLGKKLTKVPENSTETTFAWSVSDVTAASVDSAGLLVAGTPAQVPAAVVVTVLSQVNPDISATANLTVYGAEFSHLAGLKVAVDSKEQTLAFAGSTLAYELKAASATETQTLTVTATEGSTGQTLTWSTDDLKWNSLTSDKAFDVTLAKGTTTLKLRVTARTGTESSDYLLTAKKTVLPGTLTLVPDTLTLATNTTGSFAVTVAPATADDPSVTWSLDDTSLATVDASTGTITPLRPGTVKVTATAVANSAVTVTGTVTLTPSSYTLKASRGVFWTDLAASPTSAPLGTLALAGNASTLISLDALGKLRSFNGAFWEGLGFDAPAATQWLALDAKGLLLAASPTQVFYRNDGLWSASIPAPPVTIAGLTCSDSSVVIWGSDGQLWEFAGGAWVRSDLILPSGATSLVIGGSTWLAFDATTIYSLDGGFWESSFLSVVPQTSCSTFAFDQLVSLIVK